ncbi:amino acid ABC transporter permease [Cryobacterium breve]|jgi:glutamate transport system permease protein|uniref:Amino acid ABC transporter permease n=1 Tax=Cryobacterium breve TaxID=1259258 RepID=A0ABY7NBE3_9MICO|nr:MULTISPECIES: amino acid ABC transporter permease [Cryobacterium]MDY7543326.1 amino acid ABC transporter permease [Cryobacterium sp. 5B3]MEB0000490.1 amino acid ABC transporter permease [Cryobacterium sp. RTS3]MEB0265092.1 amino acid ABC transporter permease [Cryobacterium sp. 10I5]MEB0276134.1 amino acid ABC transporter permease [Cryobacterium sp. 5B3]WBM79815.1 amino acid ABC transporter permease [Cryobacterium breve]
MDAVIDNLPVFLEGFRNTLGLLVISGVGALILGMIVAGLRISPVASFRGFATVYTEIIRNTPLTLILFFCAFLLPYLQFSPGYFTLAVIGLTVYTSPFVAEAVRSGINGVHVGQAEAARSIGLGFGQSLAFVILPQALRMVVPPLINVFIALAKNTSVAGAFFVFELFGAARQVTNDRGDRVLAILLAVAVFYLLITVTLGVFAGRVEKRVAVLR